MVVQQIQNAEFHHQAGYLEHNRRKGDFLRPNAALRLRTGVLRNNVVLVLEKVHIFYLFI